MSELLPLLEVCPPRSPEQHKENYAADLHKALSREIGTPEAAADFFNRTHATDSMRRVAAGIFGRLRHGDQSGQSAFIRFDSVFGGGKTHTLIALAAAAKHPEVVRAGAAGDLLHPELAVDDVQLVCFTGEDADTIRGMEMNGTSRRAKSLTGFLAYHLGGEPAFDELKEHDDRFTDPGAAGFQKLIGKRPTLILIDEPARWVAAAKQTEDLRRAGDGLRNALTAIAKAVANSEHAVLVITTAEPGSDAYRHESEEVSQQIHAVMQELDSVTARTAQTFTPSDSEDLPAILRRRLFTDAENNPQREAAAQAYAAIWRRHSPSDADAEQLFHHCYPFHPETIRIIKERLATNNEFQRVRGTLRVIGAAIHSGAEIYEPLLHPYHLDVSCSEVSEELVRRTGHRALDAAIEADITGQNATAQRYGPATRRAANIILLGSLAPTANSGLADNDIVKGLISPSQPDSSVANQAIQNMKEHGLFIDDHTDPGTTRFSSQSNIRREVEQLAGRINEIERETGLKEAIRDVFAERNGFGVTVFPSRANNVPDDPNRVHIGIINPSFITWQSPDCEAQLADLYSYKEGNGNNAPREHKNNILFLVPNDDDLTGIKQEIARHEASAKRLEKDNQERTLMEHQRNTLITIRQASQKAAYQGIQRNWVNLYYPEPNVQPHGLMHARLNFPDQEGNGQIPIISFLTSDAIGKMASPKALKLEPSVWESAGLEFHGVAGLTVGELHGRFTRTPGRIMFLKRSDFDQALNAANQEGDQKIVVIRTPQGMDLRAGSGVPYKDDLRVWLKRHAPALAPPDPSPPPPPPGPMPEPPLAPQGIPSFASPTETGQVAVSALATYMRTYSADWNDIASATLMGTNDALLNDLASKAQSHGAAVSISYEFEANGILLEVRDQTAEDWQSRRRAFEQTRRAAAANQADARITIPNQGEADAVRKMLHDLDNTHQLSLEVQFRPPEA